MIPTLRALVVKWRQEAAIKDSFHATMGIGWKACADEVEALLLSVSGEGGEQREEQGDQSA